MTQTFYNLDRLKVCYRVSRTLWDEIKDSKEFNKGIFKCTRVLNGDGEVTVTVKIPKRITKTRETVFGTLKVKSDEVINNADERYAWFTVDNKVLYTDNENINVSQLLTQLRDTFWMIFNNVSQAEVALDVDFDAAAAIFKVIRMHREPILIMGRTITDPDETIEALTCELKTSETEFKSMELRFKCEGSKHQFYIYDKKKEIQRHRKNYILNHYKTNPETLYRMEVRLDTDRARAAAKKQRMSDEKWMYEYLLNPVNLEQTWGTASKEYIRIRRDRRHIYNVFEYIQMLGICNGVSFCHIPF